ncbi:MAG TPA: cytochrome c [Blastocatellia bacterium]|nr:cytochrome c [Blastocatellia bacterium]
MQTLNFKSSILNLRSSILNLQSSILNLRSSILNSRSSFLVLLAAVAFSACRQDMHDQPKYRPLRPVEQIGTINDGRSARPRVEGTVARGELRDDVEFYTGRIARFGQTTDKTLPGASSQSPGQPASGSTPGLQGFVSEFPMQITASDLDRGQERFNIYCAVCHGPIGDGGGMIPKRGFRRPPSYHDDRLRSAPVGYFFDVITNGFGNMPDYSAQVEPADRWRIIAYIRALQLSQRASVSDVPPDKREDLNKKPETKPATGHEGAK